MNWREVETEVLVRRACEGERGALDELLERHRPRLLRLIHCRLDPRVRSRVDESDVVQETLALASRDLANYCQRPNVPIYAWLRQIAWDQLLRVSERHLQTAKRSVLKEQVIGWEHSRGALTRHLITASTPSRAAMDEELKEQVTAALDELSEEDREILIMRYLEQLSVGEIAAVQQISEAACRKRVTRALERLRHVLGDECEEL